MLPDDIGAVKVDPAVAQAPGGGQGRVPERALRVLAAAACLAIATLLVTDRIWRLQAYESHQLFVTSGAWGYEDKEDYPATPHTRWTGYGERPAWQRSSSDKAQWEHMASTGLRTFVTLLGVALALGTVAALGRRWPRALRVVMLLGAVGVLVSIEAFGGDADEFYSRTGGGTFYASGRALPAQIASWISWVSIAVLLVDGGLGVARRMRAAEARRIERAVSSALRAKETSGGPDQAPSDHT